MLRSRGVAGAVMIASCALLAGAFFLPWYAFETTSSVGSSDQLFYLGLPTQDHTIVYTCSGDGRCSPDTSYSAANYGSVGTLTEVTLLTAIAAIGVGATAAGYGLARPGRSIRRGLGSALSVAFALLALAAPLLYAVALPSAESSDVPPSARPPVAGPWDSFVGTSSFTQAHFPTLTLQGGPSVGWFLAVSGLLVAVAGTALYRRTLRLPAPSTPVASPAS